MMMKLRWLKLIASVGALAAMSMTGCSGEDGLQLERSDDFDIFTRSTGVPDWGESLAVPYRGPFVVVDGCLYYEDPGDAGAIVQLPVFPEGSYPARDAEGHDGVALPDGTFLEFGEEYDVDVVYPARIEMFELDAHTTPCPTVDPDHSTLGLFIGGVTPVDKDG